MSARLSSLIDRRGETAGIYRKSRGTVDSYGDAAESWSLQASEKMLLRPFCKDMVSKAEVSLGVAGKLNDVENIAYAKSSSVAAVDDYLLIDSVKWRVLYVFTVNVSASARLKMLALKRFA